MTFHPHTWSQKLDTTKEQRWSVTVTVYLRKSLNGLLSLDFFWIDHSCLLDVCTFMDSNSDPLDGFCLICWIYLCFPNSYFKTSSQHNSPKKSWTWSLTSSVLHRHNESGIVRTERTVLDGFIGSFHESNESLRTTTRVKTNALYLLATRCYI